MNAKSGLAGYFIALAAVAAATVLRWLLAPLLGNELPILTYYLAVLAVAWVATIGPALLALVLGAIAALVVFTAGPIDHAVLIDFGRYFIVGGAAIVAMRSALRRAQHQQSLLAGTVRTALDAIVIIDRDDRILEFNPAAEKIFGRRREEVLGCMLADVCIPADLRERHRAGMARYLETGESRILDRRINMRGMRADGSEFPAELAVTRITAMRRAVFTAYVRDLTEAKRIEGALRDSEQQFRSLIEQVEDYAIFLLDTDGRATSWNEGVRRVLGFEEAEFRGLDVTALFTPEDVAAGIPQDELDTAARTGTASDDRWMLRKDGSRFFAIGVTIARRDAGGGLIGYAKIMRDQTERKRLEDELAETARNLAEANERQGRFLAMLSHELRNPLAPIRGAAEILRLTGQVATSEAKAAVDVINRQVGHLVRLIDDLLDVNRIRRGKIELRKTRVDLAESVAHALEVARATCGELAKNVTVDLPPEPVWVDADTARVSQVVSNLLHNACKFTPATGRIVVSLRREGSDAVIRVRDTGIGIPPEDLSRVFGMFEQLEQAPGNAHGGLGIGLSLSKSLVEMHGGTIEAHSEGVGKGSEFVVRLPVSLAQPSRPIPEPARDEPAGAKRRVLVVDDNEDAAETLAAIVRLNGHDVDCAHNGEEALEKAAAREPEIVLLDIGLPLMDGYEVARRLRARYDGRPTLVAVTGWGQEDDIRRAREAGFDAHVTKPVEYGQLLQILRGERVSRRTD